MGRYDEPPGSSHKKSHVPAKEWDKNVLRIPSFPSQSVDFSIMQYNRYTSRPRRRFKPANISLRVLLPQDTAKDPEKLPASRDQLAMRPMDPRWQKGPAGGGDLLEPKSQAAKNLQRTQSSAWRCQKANDQYRSMSPLASKMVCLAMLPS